MFIELDTSPLVKAIQSFERALEKQHELPKDEFIRDSCIQRFEYTYELVVKFLRRYLMMSESNIESVEQLSFPSLIRLACDRGLLLNDWSEWILYRDKRNITSHTYDEKKAEQIVKMLPDFLKEARYFLDHLSTQLAVSHD